MDPSKPKTADGKPVLLTTKGCCNLWFDEFMAFIGLIGCGRVLDANDLNAIPIFPEEAYARRRGVIDPATGQPTAPYPDDYRTIEGYEKRAQY
jgi:hypothetical protein